MNPKQFLVIGGIVLLLVGILGYIGVIGPTPDQSIFGEAWWFGDGENLAHTVLGVVALIAAYTLKSTEAQKWLVVVVGVVALVFTVIGFAVYNSTAELNIGVANLENPSDNILHLVVGLWALAAAFMKPKMAVTSGVPGTMN